MAVVSRSVTDICREAKRASRALAQLDRGTKDRALRAIADALVTRTDEILEANARDMEAGREAGLTDALLDRLSLDAGRIADADGALAVAALPDPVGEVVDGWRLPNGLDLRKVRSPLGVVAVVYEARPNVTIDAAVAYEFPVDCQATALTTIGSSCDVDTTADALVPGSVTEGRRSIWQMGQVSVKDAGPNRTGYANCPPACGDGDETTFLRQGVFVP